MPDGDGVIVKQIENKITVEFDGARKPYKLRHKYKQRPIVEDNEEMLDLMSERADILDRLEIIQKEHNRCQNESR